MAVVHDTPLSVLYGFYWSKEFDRIRLLSHARDHEQKIIAANGTHLFDTIVGPTTGAVNAFSSAIGAKETGLAIQVGKTSLTDIMRMDFILEVRFAYGTIKALCRTHPDIMAEFFPHGLTEFDQLTLEHAEVIIHRFALACTAHVLLIGTALATIFTDFDTNFPLTRNIQLGQMGNVGEDIVLILAAKKLLIKQLVFNTGFIVDVYPDDQASANALFNYSKLYVHESNPHEYFTGNALHNEVTNATEILVDDTKIVTVTNLGAKDFWVYLDRKSVV